MLKSKKSRSRTLRRKLPSGSGNNNGLWSRNAATPGDQQSKRRWSRKSTTPIMTHKKARSSCALPTLSWWESRRKKSGCKLSSPQNSNYGSRRWSSRDTSSTFCSFSRMDFLGRTSSFQLPTALDLSLRNSYYGLSSISKEGELSFLNLNWSDYEFQEVLWRAQTPSKPSGLWWAKAPHHRRVECEEEGDALLEGSTCLNQAWLSGR